MLDKFLAALGLEWVAETIHEKVGELSHSVWEKVNDMLSVITEKGARALKGLVTEFREAHEEVFDVQKTLMIARVTGMDASRLKDARKALRELRKVIHVSVKHGVECDDLRKELIVLQQNVTAETRALLTQMFPSGAMVETPFGFVVGVTDEQAHAEAEKLLAMRAVVRILASLPPLNRAGKAVINCVPRNLQRLIQEVADTEDGPDLDQLEDNILKPVVAGEYSREEKRRFKIFASWSESKSNGFVRDPDDEDLYLQEYPIYELLKLVGVERSRRGVFVNDDSDIVVPTQLEMRRFDKPHVKEGLPLFKNVMPTDTHQEGMEKGTVKGDPRSIGRNKSEIWYQPRYGLHQTSNMVAKATMLALAWHTGTAQEEDLLPRVMPYGPAFLPRPVEGYYIHPIGKPFGWTWDSEYWIMPVVQYFHRKPGVWLFVQDLIRSSETFLAIRLTGKAVREYETEYRRKALVENAQLLHFKPFVRTYEDMIRKTVELRHPGILTDPTVMEDGRSVFQFMCESEAHVWAWEAHRLSTEYEQWKDLSNLARGRLIYRTLYGTRQVKA